MLVGCKTATRRPTFVLETSSQQVQEARAVNSDLETRVTQLATSNEKLLDSEGRWYSLARELENQMDVIKKVSTRRRPSVLVLFRGKRVCSSAS